jgi:hypothetical protein
VTAADLRNWRHDGKEVIRLPLEPLLDALPIDHYLAQQDGVGPGVIAQAAALLDVSTRTLHRLRHTGLNPWTADRLAIAGGLHPLVVWGEAWMHAIGADRDHQARETRGPYDRSSLSR